MFFFFFLDSRTKEDKDILAQQESDNDSGDDTPRKRNSGRRKIKIEYIEDKNRRHITFSKRKAGIMKKAYELSTLTGTQVLLLVVSETGLVYTFTTVKLQPIVTKPEGKSLIQACLNAPDPGMEGSGGAMVKLLAFYIETETGRFLFWIARPCKARPFA
ncbi:hypothetical protein BC940DRAFT_239936 [Gongronella butleri]|nr:hypothetical protein BC940DRAFT_239936 [Gongronella butleri]